MTFNHASSFKLKISWDFSLAAESLLTTISEVKKVIEDLQYREQKRIAIQGIITAIKYIPYKHSAGSAPAPEAFWVRCQRAPSTSLSAL